MQQCGFLTAGAAQCRQLFSTCPYLDIQGIGKMVLIGSPDFLYGTCRCHITAASTGS